MSKLAQGSMRIGELLIFVGKLQAFWFVVLFRYAIVLGLYPATAAVIHQLLKAFENSDEMGRLTLGAFRQTARENFRLSNLAGYLSALALAFLYLDWRIAIGLMKNVYITAALGLLILILVGTLLYLLPAITRYELSLKNAYRQAFFLLLSNIPNTIAMLLGMGLALVLALTIPLLILVPVPLFLLSNAWFSYLSMRKLEKANNIGK